MVLDFSRDIQNGHCLIVYKSMVILEMRNYQIVEFPKLSIEPNPIVTPNPASLLLLERLRDLLWTNGFIKKFSITLSPELEEHYKFDLLSYNDSELDLRKWIAFLILNDPYFNLAFRLKKA